MRLSKVQKLTDHNAVQLAALSKLTASPYSGMSNAITDFKNGSDTQKVYTIYYFRNLLNQRVGWLTTVESPQRHEIWSFVAPKFRQKGCAFQMFELFVNALTPKERTHKYFVHGYHHESANRFYLKVKEVYKNSMNIELLAHYFS